MKKWLLRAVAIISAMLFGYVIYVAPVFLEHGGGYCLQDERRNGYHKDYPILLRMVKWKYTVICGIPPPIQDWGNQDAHIGKHGSAPFPIPPDGEWQISHTDIPTKYWKVRFRYAALSLPGQYHFRVGWRWDNVDDFYTFSICIKKVVYNWDNLLLHWESQRYLG